MTRTAWVFPGQGSQAIGMGMDLEDLPLAQARFAEAETVLGWSVPKLVQDPDDKVSNTLYTQPCLYVIESILADLLQVKGHQPDAVAGHSLGELTAVCASGAMRFEDGVRMVQRRAQLMQQAGENHPGGMAAILAMDAEMLDEVCKEA
ncbi:MAG: acyltransferase domain-containing protein, partial [Leptolyngbyaceae cyanobacterium SM2_5_2]|nr:acyltransferase domain-containing protein [Leptolyngbyaceae cyanobacterium SM2_5_2]